MSPHTTVSDFYKEKFGQKTYKISLDIGCTCPNRDGSLLKTGKDGNDGNLSFLGCTFCSSGGSGDFAEKIRFETDGDFSKSTSHSIIEAIDKAKKRVISKMPTANTTKNTTSGKTNSKQKFIAYFQSFTNTYEKGTTEQERKAEFYRLTNIFRTVAKIEGIVGIAIGTRPDCLSDRMLSFLANLSEQTFVQLEFGLQSSSNQTAKIINRGYQTETYYETILRVRRVAPKIHIVTHIIFGLPGENEKMMMDSVEFAVKCKTDGIKITCLHILKGTKLAEDYEQEKISPLEKEEYFSLIEHALEIIPPNVVIHRLTGDGDKKLLIAPLWTADKKVVLNGIKNILSQG